MRILVNIKLYRKRRREKRRGIAGYHRDSSITVVLSAAVAASTVAELGWAGPSRGGLHALVFN